MNIRKINICLDADFGLLRTDIGSRLRPATRGFTLLELLVVVAVIAILAALMMAFVVHGRRTAKQAQCASNLRQIFVAMQSFAADNGGKMPVPMARESDAVSVSSKLSAVEALAPYLGDTEKPNGRSPWYCTEDDRVRPNAEPFSSYGMNAFISLAPSSEEGTALPTPASPRARTMFFADAGGMDGRPPYIANNMEISGETDNGIRFRHGPGAPVSSKTGSSKVAAREMAGRANILFFDGHVQALRPGGNRGHLLGQHRMKSSPPRVEQALKSQHLPQTTVAFPPTPLNEHFPKH